jgi:hypothetical protein
MLTGVCHKCEAVYYGWGLRSPEQQNCRRCHGQLTISVSMCDDNDLTTGIHRTVEQSMEVPSLDFRIDYVKNLEVMNR